MRMRTVGASGLSVSALGLGTRNFGSEVSPEDCAELVRLFVESGGTLIDTAPAYGDGAAEEILGRELANFRREEVTLCGKAGLHRTDDGWRADTSRRGLLDQLDETLSRLRVEHLDLWLVHVWRDDPALAETLSALEFAVTSGRARYAGVANYTGWQLASAAAPLAAVRTPAVAVQARYHLLDRSVEADLLPAAAHHGVGLLAWAPLAGGVLTGKYLRSVPAASRASSADHQQWAQRWMRYADGPVVKALDTAATGLGVSPAQVALAWVRDRPGVAAGIVGARTVTQLRTTLASDRLDIPSAVRAALDEVSG
ncbi:aldo/keto reductase [Calidifontibacter sp. DB0510]|uniref:Aldo/keto reductase n=1 Tax=Metallococcus carri TaxID=1656884 RepID=A0A967AYM5_9MICO|nr:aldo/keto reductase [Metallococcus carri]NHN54832.1 aldo/keto reductase [Metallococcus carri]NOP37177.1 aldo/keto reductase [Calidifontibacter sp. DB2511S]